MELSRPDRTSRCTWNPSGGNNPHTNRSKQTDRMTILPDVLHAIGQTPLVRLNSVPKKHGIQCEIAVKCEFLNPGGSVKDRIGYRMILDAEEKGLLKPGCTIIEPTSGNTGIGLAMAAAIKGYRCIIVMPEKMSNEKVYALRALGAEIVRTPTEASFDSPVGHIATAQKLAQEIPNSIVLDQYTNAGNPLAHYDQTATEIWQQSGGKVDYLVVGAGTGGTVSGIGRKFKELSPNTKIIGVDPEGSIIARTADGRPANDVGFYEVEGIGYDFIPTSMDLDVVDSWIETNDRDSFTTARSLIKDEGLLCGGSSGANVFASFQVARDLPADKRVVVILPDGIRNYMTKFVSDQWMEARGFLETPAPQIANEWWWDLPVSKIKMTNTVVVSAKSTCEQILDVLQKGFNFVPVVEGTLVKGLVGKKKLLNALISGQARKNEGSQKVWDKSFRKVGLTSTLGRISRILEVEDCVVVEDDAAGFVGLITNEEIFAFVAQGKKEVNGA